LFESWLHQWSPNGFENIVLANRTHNQAIFQNYINQAPRHVPLFFLCQNGGSIFISNCQRDMSADMIDIVFNWSVESNIGIGHSHQWQPQSDCSSPATPINYPKQKLHYTVVGVEFFQTFSPEMLASYQVNLCYIVFMEQK
jgi:hypothetical protein